jgi:hypothetical protein
MTRTIAAILVLLAVAAVPANAAEEQTIVRTAPVSARLADAQSRPLVLPVLYASYAALAAYDVYSTKQGLALGATEANPLMTGVVGNSSTFIALKASVAIGTIFAAERLWKTNKVAAIAVMVASNSVAAVFAAKNARTLGQLR